MFASSRNSQSEPIAARISRTSCDVLLDRPHRHLALEDRETRALLAIRSQNAATVPGVSSSPGR